MDKIIITTVGTSLISKLLDKSIKFSGLKNLEKESYYDSKTGKKSIKGDLIEEDLSTTKNTIVNYYSKKESEIADSCAEISTINAIRDKLLREDAKVQIQIKVYLICTDTVLSPLCAKIIKDYLVKDNKFLVEFEENERFIIKGLRITGSNAKERFDTIGFENLLMEIDNIYDQSEWIDEKKKNLGKNIILNISGGYKALIPFLTIYGQLQGIHLNYLYEDSEKLIEIEGLPFNFDWAIMEGLRPYLSENINKNDLGNKSQTVIDKLKKLHFIREKDNQYVAIGLGKLLVTKFHESNLRNNILGTFLEYKYLQYFLDIDNSVRNSLEQYEIDYTYCYKNGTFDFDFDNTKGYTLKSKSGDIDLLLRDSSTIIEAKHFHTARKYKERNRKYKINKEDKIEEDYYKQVKAKIEAYYHIEKKYPKKFLFLVNAVLFEKDKKDYHTDMDLIDSLSYFQSMINKDYVDEAKIIFEAKICKFSYIKEDDIKVNYDKLLKTKLKETDFIPIVLKEIIES